MSEACVKISRPEVRDFVVAKAKTLNHDLDEEEVVRLYRYLQIYLRNICAKRNYRLFPYHGEIAFFSAAQGINSTRSDFQRDWEGILEQSIRIHEVPGDHYSMFSEPNVRELAKRILSCLQVI